MILMSPSTRVFGVHSVALRWIGRLDPDQRKLRLCRLIWQRGDWPRKDARGRYMAHSFALTLALRPKLWSYVREISQTRVTFLGVSVNYHHSAGGTLT